MSILGDKEKAFLNRTDRPPLCIDCEHIATSSTRETERARCLHPDNLIGISLVDGSRVFRLEYCVNQRTTVAQDTCSINGQWFKQKEILPPAVTYNPINISDIRARAKARLSKNDLDNL